MRPNSLPQSPRRRRLLPPLPLNRHIYANDLAINIESRRATPQASTSMEQPNYQLSPYIPPRSFQRNLLDVPSRRIWHNQESVYMNAEMFNAQRPRQMSPENTVPAKYYSTQYTQPARQQSSRPTMTHESVKPAGIQQSARPAANIHSPHKRYKVVV